MALLEIVSDLSGLTAELSRARAALDRIADALERLSPPIPATPERTENQDIPYEFHVSESAEEYRERQNRESQLAVSLGVTPWNEDFQSAIAEMREKLVHPRVEVVQDDNGKFIRREFPGYTEAEAESIVRRAFYEARAQAAERYGNDASGDRNPDPESAPAESTPGTAR